MNYISIKNLTVQYDSNTIFENFNKEFGVGLHWIKGFNGCGKSTLLKSLCGILPVQKNVVNLCGYDIKVQAKKAKTELCYVADKPDVFPFMTGMQYLKLIAKIKRVNLSDELFSWLDKINLSQFKETEFSKMSFGTRRKMTLSACLIGSPKVLLLDEPFNGLDANTAKSLKEWIVESKQTKCVLIASHDSLISEEEYDSILNI